MAAANRAAAIKVTLKHEGGYSNHPNDSGGPTNWGITLAVARAHWKADATASDIRSMPQSVAIEIFRRQYWDKVGGDSLPAGLDLAVFDFAVNSGVSRALTYLKATSGHTEKRIIDICDARLAFLKRAKNRNTGKALWPDFGKGWSRRVAEVRSTALKMAAGVVVPFPKPPDIPREDDTSVVTVDGDRQTKSDQIETSAKNDSESRGSWIARKWRSITGWFLGGGAAGAGFIYDPWVVVAIIASCTVALLLIVGVIVAFMGPGEVRAWIRRQVQ